MGATGASRHERWLAQRVQVRSVSAGAQRRGAGPWTGQISEAVTGRGAQQLLDAIYSGPPFRTVLRELGLTSNRVWGLTKTDDDWSATLEAALTAMRRDDLQHGTNAAYVHSCVCSECREHERIRMAKKYAKRSVVQPPGVSSSLQTSTMDRRHDQTSSPDPST
jgi:hypothetical protein